MSDSVLAICGFRTTTTTTTVTCLPSHRRPSFFATKPTFSHAQLLSLGSFSGCQCWSCCYWNLDTCKKTIVPLVIPNHPPRATANAASAPSPHEDEDEDENEDEDETFDPTKPQIGQQNPSCYHPSEEIQEQDDTPLDDARLTHAETSRTLVEVNSNATLIFSGLIDNEVHENILWSELSYVTDEHGDIYIEVNSEEDILQNLTSNDNLVKLLVGLDNIEKVAEVELTSTSDIHFGMEEIAGDDFDSDNDFEQDLVGLSEDDEDDDDEFGYELFSDWENMDTMHSSHPMYFAKKIAEAVSDIKSNWMDPPSIGLVIQGLIRPAFGEEHSTVPEKHVDCDNRAQESLKVTSREDKDKDQSVHSGTIFYKVDMINIQLVSSHGDLSFVKVQDYRQAQPDAIAHSKVNIISRLKSGGEKTTEALRSLCWRFKGIHVEEVDLTGVDSLGFDLRACSGTQIQNLRFAFKTRATSEYSAERQLYDLLFPRLRSKRQERQQVHQKDT